MACASQTLAGGLFGVLVAVSGGPDSLALALVAAEICVEKDKF